MTWTKQTFCSSWSTKAKLVVVVDTELGCSLLLAALPNGSATHVQPSAAAGTRYSAW